MIPTINDDLDEVLEFEEDRTKTYNMNLEEKTVSGTCDDAEALKQAVFKILNTERYRYIAYSWDYGFYSDDLFGMPYDYVCAELKRRIADALSQDDRIKSVDDFTFSKYRNAVTCKFTVYSIYGNFNSEKVVEL